MKNLRSRRGNALSALVAALALLVALPAAALAAEAGVEAPSGETTSEAPPPSPGWVPQGSGAEGSGGGDPGVRQGSSLGSGGAAAIPDRSSSEEPSYEAPPSDSTYYPPESPSAPVEESTSAPEVEAEVEPVAPPPAEPPAREAGVAAVGGATALTPPDRLRVAGVQAESAAVASQAADSSSGPDLLWWLAIAVCALLLIYAAGKLVLEPTELFRR